MTNLEVTGTTEGVGPGSSVVASVLAAAVGVRRYSTGKFTNQDYHIPLVLEPLSGDVHFFVD